MKYNLHIDNFHHFHHFHQRPSLSMSNYALHNVATRTQQIIIMFIKHSSYICQLRF